MRLLLINTVFILAIAAYALYTGYEYGYECGRRETNAWWIDQKSTYKDTKDVLEKHRKEGWDNV